MNSTTSEADHMITPDALRNAEYDLRFFASCFLCPNISFVTAYMLF